MPHETDTGMDDRRKRILYRCQHRGMKEMDIFLGEFAKAHVARLSESDLADLERLMDVFDQDLLKWMTGRQSVPVEHDTPVYRAIISFRQAQVAAES